MKKRIYELTPPVVLITGATKGIGRALVEVFAAKGYNIIAMSRTAYELDSLQAPIQKKYQCSVYTLAIDLSIDEEVQRASEWLLQHFTSLDVVIHNAGRFIRSEILSESNQILNDHLSLNLWYPYCMTKQIQTLFKARTHLFFMGSIAAHKSYDKSGSYSISKFALKGLCDAFRLELAPKGIKVSFVSPGAVFTEAWSGENVRIENMILPEDIAKLIYASAQLSAAAYVEDIIIKPLKGHI